MRTDAKLAEGNLRASPDWKKNEIGGADDQGIDHRLEDGDEMVDGKLMVHSLSGHERNHFFLNHRFGDKFSDLSALSGLDSDSDSRGFVTIDYDRDGWQDVALVNANNPLTQLYHNDLGQLLSTGGGMVALRFEGGNKTAVASEWSNRDGYGAVVEVTLPDGTHLKREHRCGDGYAAQNSRTMLIGIGEAKEVTSVKVRWPSGKTSGCDGIVEGTLVTMEESGEFRKERYRREIKRPEVAPADATVFPLARKTPGKIQVYTTMATWCPSCLKHLPLLANLADDGVALFGVPIDPKDDEEKLDGYVARNSPPYEMLRGISGEQKEGVNELLSQSLKIANPGLPSSIIADADGHVLEVMQGIPTVSRLRKWMR